MDSFALVIAITAFLAGGAAGMFVMLVIGIRKGDRPRRGPARNTPLDAATRSMLRANTWPNNPVVHGDPDQP
ncbi:MAG: hypothetical protein ABSB59_43720 [Streptosporangiaceae bacterium]|jgi:hypothetical protein